MLANRLVAFRPHHNPEVCGWAHLVLHPEDQPAMPYTIQRDLDSSVLFLSASSYKVGILQSGSLTYSGLGLTHVMS
jgi:hypothetical protein